MQLIKNFKSMFKYLIIIMLFFSLESYGQWTPQSTGTSLHLRGVNFVDSLTGVSVGHFGTIIKTIDGGNNWYDIPSPNTMNYWKVQFISDSIGYISGGGGSLLYTNDQGETWELQNTGVNFGINKVYFLTDSVGWAVGFYGTIRRTNNQGNTWEDMSINQIDEYSAITFINDSIGYLTGNSILYRTTNGGETWDDISFTNVYITDILFVNDQIGWLCGEDGLLYKTEDGGVNWFPKNSNIDEWLHDVFFIDSDKGWAVGRHGKVIYTVDGGENWIPYANPVESNHHLISIDFEGENHGWACASDGVIIKYSQDTTLTLPNYLSEEVTVYPNPTQSALYINYTNQIQILKVELYDINNQLVNTYNSNNPVLDVSTLPSGVYLLKISGLKGEYVEKIILE